MEPLSKGTSPMKARPTVLVHRDVKRCIQLRISEVGHLHKVDNRGGVHFVEIHCIQAGDKEGPH